MQVGHYKPCVLLVATLEARPLAVCLVVESGEVSLVARARGALPARCGWRACCCGWCGLAGVRLGLHRLPAGPGGVFGAAGVGRALACRGVLGLCGCRVGVCGQAAGLPGLGGGWGAGRFGRAGGTADGGAGLAALWEIKKFFGGPRCCIPRNEIS